MAATGPSSPDAPREAASEAAKGAAAAESSVAAAPKSDEATNDATGGPAEASAPPASKPAPAPPTYLSTKSSRAYALSKQLLQTGALDDALSTLEMALQLSKQMLAEQLANSKMPAAGGDPEADLEMHESLAPLHYLYGTTLLYSVEESDVMMANGQMAAAGGAPTGDIEVNDGEAGNDDGAPAGKAAEGGEGEGGEEGEEAAAVADPAEDLQIAWENLDLARTIISRLVEPFVDEEDDAGAMTMGKSNFKNEAPSNNGTAYTDAEKKELLLDLAQVHVRLGDLQRADGNVLPSLPDYESALKLRVRCLGKFDRKVADSHFSLAGVYAEAPSRAGENEGKVENFVSSLTGGGEAGMGGMGDEEKGEALTEAEKREFRMRSLEHYLACGVAFAGIMAEMCGEDAEKFTSLESDSGASSMAAASSAATASSHCKSMTAIRQRLATLTPPTSPAKKEEFDDLKEMVDEIQEAMDSAEETEEGLRSLGEMKANEIRKHEAKSNGEGVEETLEGGATTTIGFGAPSGSSGFAAAGAGAVNAFGSTAATAASATAAPMMVVKKKKKKPAQDEESAKRLKTN
ncbi:hypothetical protein ACHAXT_001345 [Thalassiosira profunda]